MYESSFSKLPERFFKDKPWPKVDAISHLTGDDHVFSMLYSEMYYRHVYARLQPTLEQRCESWDNYCELFKVILGTKINMQLPNSWLWDMVDDFIYQFQSYCAYRAKLRRVSNTNAAACHLKMEAWRDASKACDAVLKEEPENVKAPSVAKHGGYSAQVY